MNSTKLERRMLKNTIVGVIAFLANLSQTILLVPILLQAWGKEIYGIWLSISAFQSLLQTIDTGHQNYLSAEFCKLYPQKDKQLQLKKNLASGIWIAFLLGITQIVIVVIIVKFNLLESFLGTQLDSVEFSIVSKSLIILVSSWVLSGSVGGILVRLYYPAGLYSRGQWLGIFMRLSITLSLIFTAILGKGLVFASVFYAIVINLISGLIFFDTFRFFKSFYPFWVGGSWSLGIKNLSHSIVLTSVGVLSQFQVNGQVLIISSILGVAIMPGFTTMRTLSNAFLMATSIITSPLVPEIARYHVLEKPIKLIGVISTTWWSSGILINFGLLATLPFIETLYTTWTRGKLPFDWSLYLLLSLSICLKNIGSPLITYLSSINHLRSQGVMATTQTSIVLGGTVLFLQAFGLQAAAWSVLAGELVGSLILPIYFVEGQLNALNASLPRKQLSLSVIALIIMALTFICTGFLHLDPIITVLFGTLSLVIVYFWQWKLLSVEVKERLYGLLPFKIF